MKMEKQRLEKIFNECDVHLKRINSAYRKMSLFMPLDRDRYDKLSEDEIEHIDQYLFRFSKLQDAMGKKLFKNMLLYLQEDIEGLAFIDILHKLEKLSLLKSAKQWIDLRNIRNELAHQYDDDAEAMSAAINEVYKQKEVIETIYHRIKTYYDNKAV